MSEPIQRDLTVTINGNTAKLNSKMYLYRGDRDIQLNFTIIDTQLKFKDGEGNILRLEDNSFCKILIKKPSGEFVRTQRAEIKNGVAVFLITADLCDELDEVGEITLQIRIYTKDVDESPRWTFPPFGDIIVQEPMGDFMDDSTPINEIGTAEVGVSMVSSVSEELIITDENGLYSPTVWNDGDVISKERVNKIESGIRKNSEDLNSINTIVGKVVSVSSAREGDSKIWIVPKYPPLTDDFYYLDEWSQNKKFSKVNGKYEIIDGEGNSVNPNRMTVKKVSTLNVKNNTSNNLSVFFYFEREDGTEGYTSVSVEAGNTAVAYCQTTGQPTCVYYRASVQSLINPGDIEISVKDLIS